MPSNLRGIDGSADLSQWSDERLRSTFLELIYSERNQTWAKNWPDAAVWSLVLIGFSGVASLLERASTWQINAILAGVAGGIWAYRLHRKASDNRKVIIDLMDELERRHARSDGA